MIHEERKTKKEYICISFFLDRNSTKSGVFVTGDASIDRLSQYFGITNLKKYNQSDGTLTMIGIFDLINDVINVPGVKMIGVSEDMDSMRYHFIIE